MLMAISSSGAVTITGEMSGSDAANALLLDGTGSLSFTTTASYNAFSASYAIASGSLSSRTTQVERTYASTGSNTFTGAQYVSDASNGIGFTSTASFYTDGGLRVGKNAYVSGTAYFNNIVVFGTSSIQYITSSQVNIGANIITVNTDTPAVRFGGLSVFDSGSTQLTGSIFWDSEKNHWVYSNPSGSSYSGGMFISGPRSSALGCEQGTTACMLLVGQGGDHLTSSLVYHDSARTCFYGNALFVTSSGNVGIGTSTPTGGISGTETALEISNSNVGVLALTSTAASGKKYQVYSSNDGGLFFRDSTCAAQRMMISTLGNVGIGTTDIVSTNLSGALTIRKSYSGDTPNGATTQDYYLNQSALYLFGRNSGLTMVSNNSEEGTINFGNNSTRVYASINTSTGTTSSGGDMYFKVGSNTERLRILNTGIFCFSCQVCVPQLIVCRTYNANNLMLSVANSTMSVPFMTYDTAIIQADDVTTLKLVERNGGSTDNQILTLSVGDNTTRISTNGPNPLQFFVGGSSAGCGYNGLGGNNALSIACSGTSTFNYPIIMANIGHYTNYRSTSGCFAIFCASQGAILYVTSMHNNGRATYQLVYSNGPTGGASISVIGSTSAYGPASTAFGLCANGWVYGYQQYGGPTDYYAINMNGTFAWAF
jgi:hypothetical protein